MKRYIAGVACATTAVLSVPALTPTAHAGRATDPVAALKNRIRSGHGLKFTDVATITDLSGKRIFSSRREGVFRFGTAGVIASEHVAKLRFRVGDLEELMKGQPKEHVAQVIAGLAKPERIIRLGDASYVSGGLLSQNAPAGKTWFRSSPPALGLTGMLSQPLNAAEPGTLKALLAHATRSAGGYRGKITFGELSRVSPWFRATRIQEPTPDSARSTVSWTLTVGANRLAKRLTATFRLSDGSPTALKVKVRTDYSRWGVRVTVKAPPADQIALSTGSRPAADRVGPLAFHGG